jgi:hypothetical protein
MRRDKPDSGRDCPARNERNRPATSATASGVSTRPQELIAGRLVRPFANFMARAKRKYSQKLQPPMSRFGSEATPDPQGQFELLIRLIWPL